MTPAKMSELKLVLVAHMGHNAPWLQIKTIKKVKARRVCIRFNKPEREVHLRLKLLKIVDAPLPSGLVKAYAAWVEADATWDKTNATWVKANTTWVKANATWDKAINSPAGVEFHKQVCGCAWTPEQPDILRQLKE